jgi:uncharacterized membrane protein YphA (DoxX/SURF4 family)
LDTIGLIIFSSLFVHAGYTHIKNHAALVGYTTSALGDCPLAKPLGFLGGWPTGVFLAVFGVGTAVNEHSIFAYGLAGFLAVATALFHRNFLTDPGGFKTLSLAGAALYIASQVH